MKTSHILLSAGALAALGLASHVPVALSTPFGATVLSEITYFKSTGDLGVPAYVAGADEHGYHVHDGTTFHASNGTQTETMVFEAADFVNVHHAEPVEIADAINADMTLVEAFVENDTLVFRGLGAGSDAMLQLTDDVGAPLFKFGMVDGDATSVEVFGSDDIDLVLSVGDEGDDGEGGHGHGGHGDDHGGSLAGYPYLVIASTTPGTTPVAGFEVPFVLDGTTDAVVRAMKLGLVENFDGHLDAEQDAFARFDADLIDVIWGDATPDELYFAFVVFDPELSGIEFVSNRFTVDIE